MLRTEPQRQRTSAWTPRRLLGAGVAVAAVALPWTWFLIRGIGPGMDAVAVGLPAGALVVALAALALAAAWSRPYASLVALSFLLFGVAVVVEPRIPESSPAPQQPFRLVAANVLDANTRARDAVRAIVELEPQVLVAVEAPEDAARALETRFPNAVLQGHGSLGVYSSWPVVRLGDVSGVPSASAIRVRVERPAGPLVVYALHLSNPLHDISFGRHLELVGAVLAAAREEELPVVLAGDLNLSDRAEGYRRLHDAFRDAMRTSWPSSTYDGGAWIVLQLRIDHVFVSRTLCAAGARAFPLPGSDHDGLKVQLGACR